MTSSIPQSFGTNNVAAVVTRGVSPSTKVTTTHLAPKVRYVQGSALPARHAQSVHQQMSTTRIRNVSPSVAMQVSPGVKSNQASAPHLSFSMFNPVVSATTASSTPAINAPVVSRTDTDVKEQNQVQQPVQTYTPVMNARQPRAMSVPAPQNIPVMPNSFAQPMQNQTFHPMMSPSMVVRGRAVSPLSNIAHLPPAGVQYMGPTALQAPYYPPIRGQVNPTTPMRALTPIPTKEASPQLAKQTLPLPPAQRSQTLSPVHLSMPQPSPTVSRNNTNMISEPTIEVPALNNTAEITYTSEQTLEKPAPVQSPVSEVRLAHTPPMAWDRERAHLIETIATQEGEIERVKTEMASFRAASYPSASPVRGEVSPSAARGMAKHESNDRPVQHPTDATTEPSPTKEIAKSGLVAAHCAVVDDLLTKYCFRFIKIL